MYARGHGDRELTFDFAEGLLQDNLLVFDRETESLWSQLAGKAVHGPLEGTPLSVVPSVQTTWKHWRKMRPDTRVMLIPDEEGRRYVYRNRLPGEPQPKKPPKRHNTELLGLGLVVGDEAIYFPFRELRRAETPLTLEVGGEEVTVHFERGAPSAWAEDAAGRLLPAVLAYEWGWKEFHPEGRIFEVGEP